METTSFFSKIKSLYIVIGAVILLGLSVWSIYNGLVKANIAVDTAWAQVEVQYQRRFDLIPNLVATTQGIEQQEKDVFGAIAQARQGYAGAQTVDQKVQATGQIESAMGRLLVIMENYPQLRSSEAFTNLQVELSGTENRVSVERSRFNQMVSSYNIRVKTFPGNLLAGLFGFENRPLLTVAEGVQNVPKVNFTK